MLIIAIGIRAYSYRDLETCHSGVLIPTIKEVGSEFVILNADNGVMLTRNRKYEIELGGMVIKVKLLNIDQAKITFAYESVMTNSGEDNSHSKTIEYQCKLIVPYKDTLLGSPQNRALLKPVDFNRSWVVNHYLEYRTNPAIYQLSAQSFYLTFMEAERQTTNGLSIPYEIFVRVFSYDTEAIAIEAFVEGEELLQTLYGAHRHFNLDSQFSKQTEFCFLTVDYTCSYIGQSGKYVVEIEMRIPHQQLAGISIPIEDWQYLVSLVESKTNSDNH
jgi:hypothetical protein